MEKKDLFSINREIKTIFNSILTKNKTEFIEKTKLNSKINSKAKISPVSIKKHLDFFLKQTYSEFSSNLAKVLGSYFQNEKIEENKNEKKNLSNFTSLEQYYIEIVMNKLPDKDLFIEKCLEIQKKEGNKSLSRKLHFFVEKKIKKINLTF